MKKLSFALLLCFIPFVVEAGPLKVVNVSAPAINCVFNPTCTVTVNDTSDNITMSTGGAVAISCIDWMTISFGPVVGSLNYGADAKPDQVFVVTGGGIGTIGIASAVQTGSSIKFKFTSPVCEGGAPGKGDSSFFWGLVSKKPPQFVTATLHEPGGVTHTLKARSPT